MIKPWRTLVGTALGGMIAITTPAAASTCFDKAVITDYDPGLIRAIQQRLRDRNLYGGAIDGKVGPATRRGLAQLTGNPLRSDFHLGSDMVERIFGLEASGIYYPEDQDALIAKLGASSDANYRNKCRVHVSDE
ncbi:hypothetical protein U1701_07670 [Sphingomonas sp. PB2P19]|uniref:peptidoglycan-binding domain-containing protein n=1 Tax=Sphingomonas rhamnosi TaxID=3096156 RepID=UPI002FCB86D7